MASKNIQVLLEKDATEALLEVKGPYYIINPHDKIRIASGLLGTKWGEEFPSIHQIYIQPRSEETSIFVNGIQYDGAIAIYGVAGMINIVNDVDIEHYVKGILSPQFPTVSESEVLSALAILTRTDAYYRATRHTSSFWHVGAREVGYLGSALVVQNSPIQRAVDSTKHLILVHSEHGKKPPLLLLPGQNTARGKQLPISPSFAKKDSDLKKESRHLMPSYLAKKQSGPIKSRKKH